LFEGLNSSLDVELHQNLPLQMVFRISVDFRKLRDDLHGDKEFHLLLTFVDSLGGRFDVLVDVYLIIEDEFLLDFGEVYLCIWEDELLLVGELT
jgi:hypothetical protein